MKHWQISAARQLGGTIRHLSGNLTTRELTTKMRLNRRTVLRENLEC